MADQAHPSVYGNVLHPASVAGSRQNCGKAVAVAFHGDQGPDDPQVTDFRALQHREQPRRLHRVFLQIAVPGQNRFCSG